MKTILTTSMIIQEIVRKVAKDLGCAPAVANLLAENYVIDKPLMFHKWLKDNCVSCTHDPSYCNYWNPETNMSPDEFEHWRLHDVLKYQNKCPEKELPSMDTSSDTDSNP